MPLASAVVKSPVDIDRNRVPLLYMLNPCARIAFDRCNDASMMPPFGVVSCALAMGSSQFISFLYVPHKKARLGKLIGGACNARVTARHSSVIVLLSPGSLDGPLECFPTCWIYCIPTYVALLCWATHQILLGRVHFARGQEHRVWALRRAHEEGRSLGNL